MMPQSLSALHWADRLCPLFTKPARSTQPPPGLTYTIWKMHTDLRAAERKWCKSSDPSDLKGYRSFLYFFSSSISAAKTAFYNDKFSSTTDTWKLFSTFKTLINPPPPPPDRNLSADIVASFVNEKLVAFSSQFSEPLKDNQSPPVKGASFSLVSRFTKGQHTCRPNIKQSYYRFFLASPGQCCTTSLTQPSTCGQGTRKDNI